MSLTRQLSVIREEQKVNGRQSLVIGEDEEMKKMKNRL